MITLSYSFNGLEEMSYFIIYYNANTPTPHNLVDPLAPNLSFVKPVVERITLPYRSLSQFIALRSPHLTFSMHLMCNFIQSDNSYQNIPTLHGSRL